MTKGTRNYDTLISSYCVSHGVTTERLKFKSDWGIKITVFYTK